MRHAKALILPLAVAVLAGCATAAGGGPEEADTGVRPRDTEGTTQASIHLLQGNSLQNEAQSALGEPEEGQPPQVADLSAEAAAEYEQALQFAVAGIEEMPSNPKAYLIAGQAAVGLRNWAQADTMFDRALDLYPGYAEDLALERQDGALIAYQLGAQALEEGSLDEAEANFEGADRLMEGMPEARIALGSVYVQRGETEAAAEAYMSALEVLEEMPDDLDQQQQQAWLQARQTAALNATDLLAQSGRFDEAASLLESYLDEAGDNLDAQTSRRLTTALAGLYAQAGDSERADAIYEELLGGEDLTENEYLQAGAGYFNTGDYERATAAFAAAAEMNPYSQIALLNLVSSLYSQAMELEQAEDTSDEELRSLHQRTIDAAEQLRELDPLNRNVVSFMLRSYRALADLSDQAQAQQLGQRTQELFRAFQNQPFDVTDVQVMPQGGQAQITGNVTNLSGQAGETIVLEFELLNRSGQPIGSADVQVTLPAQGEATQFSETASVQGEFAGWRYSLRN